MATIVTRTGFCQACYDADRPRLGNSFLVEGSTGKKLKVIKAIHYGKRGYVPTLFRFCKETEKRIKGKMIKEVFYQTLCSSCGSYWGEELVDGREARFLYMDEEKWSGWKRTTLTNWNACVLTFKHIGLEV